MNELEEIHMQRIKKLSKLSFLLIMVVAGLVTFSSTTQAANLKPYEYTFKPDPDITRTFNGISGVKQLDITFDNEIPVTSIAPSDILVEVSEEKKGEAATVSTVDILDKAIISADKKTLSVHFKNLDYIDYTSTTKSYKLIIKSGAGLYLGQAGDLVFPFAIHDVLPGFKSVFLDLPYNDIDSKVFVKNPPRDIYVHIPKYYLTKIETIHRYKGVVSTKEAATLTNIDVLTDGAVARLKVDLDGDLIRDLEPHPNFKGFTMGYASDQKLEVEDLKEFSLKAYDGYGRILDATTFKINYIDLNYLDNEHVKVSNYITKKASDFGKTYTLYDLMAKEKIFENILTSIKAEELNKLGVTYANQFSSVSVATSGQLAMALANPNIKTIDLLSDITAPVTGLVINHDVTINGNGKEITGDVKLGDGTKDLNINLNNLVISNTLTVDVGTGNVIADSVTVNGAEVATNPSVIIVSGGVNSIHFINFTAANGITINNAAPVRVVLTNSVDKPKVNVTLTSGEEVILEGAFGTVTSKNKDARLTVRNGIEISGWSIGEGMKLTVTRPSPDTKLPDKGETNLGILEILTSGETTGPGDGNEDVIDLGTVVQLVEVQSAWATSGQEIKFNAMNNGIASEINTWVVSNPDVFGSGTVAKIDNELKMLTIVNLSLLAETENNIILTAVHDDGKEYKVTVPVKVKVETEK